MRFTIEKVTPDRAKSWLEDWNTDNYRPLLAARAQRHALEMKQGRWTLNGESIKFSADGTLLDGQHRLMACVIADEPFETVVVWDMERGSALTLDWGAKRSLADVLRRQGETDTMVLASAIGLGWRRDLDRLGDHAIPSPQEAIAWLAVHPGLREAVRRAKSMRGRPLRVPPSAAGLFVFDMESVAPYLADEFRHLLVSGAELAEDSPVFSLRRLLSSQRGDRPSAVWFLAVLTKTWNAWVMGRKLRIISWRDTEPFPQIAFPPEMAQEA